MNVVAVLAKVVQLAKVVVHVNLAALAVVM
jgi:hypothetical protein